MSVYGQNPGDGDYSKCRAKDPNHCPYHVPGSHGEMSAGEAAAYNERNAEQRAASKYADDAPTLGKLDAVKQAVPSNKAKQHRENAQQLVDNANNIVSRFEYGDWDDDDLDSINEEAANAYNELSSIYNAENARAELGSDTYNAVGDALTRIYSSMS